MTMVLLLVTATVVVALFSTVQAFVVWPTASRCQRMRSHHGGSAAVPSLSSRSLAIRASSSSSSSSSLLEEWTQTFNNLLSGGGSQQQSNIMNNNNNNNDQSPQEQTARAFFQALSENDVTRALNDYCIIEDDEDDNDDAFTFEHASFNQAWVGRDTAERLLRLLSQSNAQSMWWGTSLEIDKVVADAKSRPDKLAVRFVMKNNDDQDTTQPPTRGVAVLEFDNNNENKYDAVKIKRVFWVSESPPDQKGGADSLNLLRAATKVMDLTGYNPAATKGQKQDDDKSDRKSNEKSSSMLAPLAYFEAWNRRDLDAAVDVFDNEVTYEDTAFPEPFQGKEALRNHLQICADCFPDSFSFVHDDCVIDQSKQFCFVQWHVENNGEALPYTRGTSVYQLNAKNGKIVDGIDFLEPNGPIKPGGIDLWKQTVSAQLQSEPIRVIPLVSWIAYIGIVFFSDGILPGANALQLEPRTWEEVLNLSLNFFFVSPVLGLPFSPVVHPLLESVFNSLLAWAALFAGFLTDERRTKPNLFPMVPAVIGMQLLTSAFYLPYLAFRTSEHVEAKGDAVLPVRQEELQDSLPASIGENRILPAVLGSVGAFSIYWAFQGRVDDFGSAFPERWASFIELLSIDRVGSSFVVDLIIFGLFQGWLVEDDALRRGGVSPVLKNVAKYVPFFGLVAYMGLRPSLPTKEEPSNS